MAASGRPPACRQSCIVKSKVKKMYTAKTMREKCVDFGMKNIYSALKIKGNGSGELSKNQPKINLLAF